MRAAIIALVLLLQSCMPVIYYASTDKAERRANEETAVWVAEAALWYHFYRVYGYYDRAGGWSAVH